MRQRFVCLGAVACAWVRRLLLRYCLRLVTQDDVDRKVVGADILESPHLRQAEVLRVKDVIDRNAEARVARVEGADEAATLARLQQAADFLKEPGRVRPCNVIQITADNDWPGRFRHSAAYLQ